MSRVHDALRKAEQGGNARPKGRRPGGGPGRERRQLFLSGDQPVRDVPVKLRTADGRSRRVRVDAIPFHAGADRAALVWARAVVD